MTKTSALLSVTKATTQARRIVDKFIPGVMATVESRLSHDLDADVPIVITTITFPADRQGCGELSSALTALPGYRGGNFDECRIEITRARS